MYPLLPWKWLGTALTVVVAMAVYLDDLAQLIGVSISDRIVIRHLPLALLAFLGGFFGPVSYWAPWRVLWRMIPALNRWVFPDLNGIWLGTTGSNWPTIKKMFEAAQAHRTIDKIDKDELHSTPEQHDAIALQITASLFSIKLAAGLSSTDGQSCSVTAKPRRDQHSGRIHLNYVYEQSTPDPSITDGDQHMGAAELTIDLDDLEKGEGVYWTRRSWKIGLNTAGSLELRRVSYRIEKGKSLRQYAADEKARIAGTTKI